MPANANTGGVAMEVPLGRRCREDFLDVNIEGRENASQFVHQGDVNVALHVFNHFSRLSDFEFTDVANILAGKLAVKLNQNLAHFGVGAADDASDLTDAVGGIAWIEAFGTIGDFKIFADDKTQFVHDGHPCLCRDARVNGGFQHHDGIRPLRDCLKDCSTCCLHIRQIWLEVMGDRRRNRHEDDIAMGNGFGRGGGDMPALCSWRRDDVVNVRVTGGVFPGHHHVDGSLRDVNAPDLKSSVVEANGGGKAYIAKTNDADCLHGSPTYRSFLNCL